MSVLGQDGNFGSPKRAVALFFLHRSKRRLPTSRRTLLARRSSDGLDLFLFRFLGLSITLLLAFGHAILHELMVKLTRLRALIDLVSCPIATLVRLRRSASHVLPLLRLRKPVRLGRSDEALLPFSMLVLQS
jgi:hypothetical protein